MDLTSCRLFASVLILCYIANADASVPLSKFLETEKYARDEPDTDSLEDANNQRIREEDLRKLILKKLRFRDLDDQQDPTVEQAIARLTSKYAANTGGFKPKRGGINSALVNKVAALLSGLKTRQIESPNVRMPSLRFGK